MFPFVLLPFIVLFGLLGFVIGVASFIFWIVMLVDAIQRKFKSTNDKIVWVLVIIFTHIVGAVIYYFLVKKHNRK